jgi:heme exporter protein A
MLITATRIACERGGRQIFSDLSLTLDAGVLMELRGPNGSGKSSLLRVLAGFNEVSEGEVLINGATAYVGHSDAIKLSLTVAENLEFWNACFGGSGIEEALAVFNLEALAEDHASLLSQGQKRRLALAQLALVRRPVWLLDEPTVGLDTTALTCLRVLLQQHLAAGGAAVVATHAGLGVSNSTTLELALRA